MRTSQAHLFTLGLVLSVVCSLSYSDVGPGLLWRVHKPGSPVSYIFGTIHVSDSRVKALNSQILKRFNEAKTICLEILPNREVQVSIGRAMMQKEGQTLDQQLGNNLFSKVSLALNKQGMTPIQALYLKPWAAMVLISRPQTGAGYALDEHLYHLATHQYKQLCALETVEEQLGIFDDLDIDKQIILLRDALEHLEQVQSMNKQLIETYLTGNLDKLYELGTSMQGSDDALTAQIRRRLIHDRNQTMLSRMLPVLEQGRSFIAVGALHLPGDDGLLQLLRNNGFVVTPPEINVQPW
ncbi:TraB/GumN family protein [Bermanella sp. R86510]|uniref:TraB/GumN family protein n=1 Tax=unclassified Bermanella TaxID=2627862 RepID=UPI0037C780F2